MTDMERVRPIAQSADLALRPPRGSPSVHLDALRGFAAFSVLISHWRDAFYLDYSQIGHHNPLIGAAYLLTGLGHQWVIVFFVMSGYLVGSSVLRAVDMGTWSWRAYLLARLTRLYIVLLPALLLGGVLDWTGMNIAGADVVYNGHSGMHTLAFDMRSSLTLPTFVANSLFLQTIVLPGAGGHPVPTFGSNGPLWSLCNEFWYYLAFPLLVLLLAKPPSLHTTKEGSHRRGVSWWLRVICGLGLLCWVWFVGAEIALLGISWLMGVLIGYLPPFPAGRSWTRGLVVMLALTLLGGGLVLNKTWPTRVSELIVGGVVTFLIWVTLYCATAPLPESYVRLAQRSAHSSYTLYLVHVPLLIFFKASLHLPRAVPGWHMFLVSIGLLIAVLLYAQLVYELFEKRTTTVRNWIKPWVMGRNSARGST